MCLLIYFVCSLILLFHGGQCELTWDKVYGLLSAKLDKIILEQDVMKTEIKDLMTSVTAINQQGIAFEKSLSELATLSQQLVVVHERLDNIDSHVKDVATAEVGRRTHLLRRGLEQEKVATQSRFDKTMNHTRDLSARVDILDNNNDILKSEIKQTSEKTGVQIATVQQEVVITQRNTQTLQSRVDTMERTQSDLQSKTRTIETQVDTSRGQIATVQQEVVTTQRNTQTLQSRVDTFERMQSDLQSKASSIATQVDTTRGQIATVHQEVLTTQRNAQTMQSRLDSIERTQSDLQSKTQTIETQVDTTRWQISKLQSVTGTFVGFSAGLYGYTNGKYNKDEVIKFNLVYYSEGGHYSSSTGIFTAPVSGVYVFMFNVEVYYENEAANKVAVVLRVNGQDYTQAIAQALGRDTQDFTGGNAAVLKVLAGDRVYISTSREGNTIWPPRTSFSGALLHVS